VCCILKRGLLYSALLLCISLVIASAWIVWFAKRTATKAYACEWSAELVIDYMKANQNAWPRSWQDLRVQYDDAKGSPPSFEEMQRFIMIDWNTDPVALQKVAYDQPFEEWETIRVIRLKDGSRTHWKGYEPNQTILNYLGGIPRLR